jgi:hypothetical protein
MRTALMVLALLAAPAFASQSVWKWVDEKGVTHYSDRPVPGAQLIEVSVGSRADPVPTSPSPAPSATSSPPPAETASYRNFEIWSPADGDTLVNTGGIVEVRMRLEPALQRGHAIYVYLDGKLIENFPTDALDYTLQEVPRGVHSLTAVVQDGAGKRVRETTTRFTVRQESIAQPPVGPALRQTPPKPRGQTGKLPTTQPSYAALNGQRPQIDPRTNLPVKKK